MTLIVCGSFGCRIINDVPKEGKEMDKKDMAALGEQWANTAPAEGGVAPSDLPDGTYEFVVAKVKANTNKFGLRITYRVVGGNESYIGEEITVQDNLDTAQNMGWFKDRCRRLGIDKEEMMEGGRFSSFDAILADDDTEGSIAAELLGKKFEGLKQHKKGFDNVYVNKLLGTASAGELGGGEESGAEAGGAEQEEQQEATPGEIAEGAKVEFTSKADGPQVGVVAEKFEDGGVERVRVDAENGKRYNLPLANVTLVAEEGAAEEQPAEEQEEVEETPKKAAAAAPAKKVAIPKYPAVKTLKLPDIRAILAGYKFAPDSVAKPREFLQCVAGMKGSAAYKPDLAELAAASAALGVKKAAKPADTVKLVREAVLKRFK